VEEVQNVHFTLFPNPAYEAFYIEFETQTPSQLQIFSTDGKLLKTQKMDNNETIVKVNVNSFSNGLYYVSLVFEDFVLNRKIIIQN